MADAKMSLAVCWRYRFHYGAGVNRRTAVDDRVSWRALLVHYRR